MTQYPPLENLWTAVNNLRVTLKVPPIAKLGKIWDVQVDSEFRLFVNGSNQLVDYLSPMGGSATKLRPYEAHVYFGDWLAGTFGPYTGTFVAHENCNSGKFVAAIEKRIKEVPAQ